MSTAEEEDEIVSEMSWVSLLYKVEDVLNKLAKECIVINNYNTCVQKLDICDDIQNQILKYIYSIVDYEEKCKIVKEYNLVRDMFE